MFGDDVSNPKTVYLAHFVVLTLKLFLAIFVVKGWDGSRIPFPCDSDTDRSGPSDQESC